MDPSALDRPMMNFSIPEELAKIKSDPSTTGKGVAVLVKNEHVRIVLAVLPKGEALQEHQTAGQITVSVVQGAVRFNALGEQVNLTAGGLVTLHPGIRHSVEALEDSAFVITVCV